MDRGSNRYCQSGLVRLEAHSECMGAIQGFKKNRGPDISFDSGWLRRSAQQLPSKLPNTEAGYGHAFVAYVQDSQARYKQPRRYSTHIQPTCKPG